MKKYCQKEYANLFIVIIVQWVFAVNTGNENVSFSAVGGLSHLFKKKETSLSLSGHFQHLSCPQMYWQALLGPAMDGLQMELVQVTSEVNSFPAASKNVDNKFDEF